MGRPRACRTAGPILRGSLFNLQGRRQAELLFPGLSLCCRKICVSFLLPRPSFWVTPCAVPSRAPVIATWEDVRARVRAWKHAACPTIVSPFGQPVDSQASPRALLHNALARLHQGLGPRSISARFAQPSLFVQLTTTFLEGLVRLQAFPGIPRELLHGRLMVVATRAFRR